MVPLDKLRTALDIIGNTTALCMFLAPVRTFLQVWQWRSTRKFSGIVYPITLLNCLLWVFYAAPKLHPSSVLICTTNLIGAVLEIVYISLYLFFSKKSVRIRMLGILAGCSTFLCLVIVLTLKLAQDVELRSKIVGIIVATVDACMYASPLIIMKNVIKTKSARYLPPLLSFAILMNGLVWTGRGALDVNISVIIPNALGALLGAFQLLLHAIYCDGKESDDDAEEGDGAKVSESDLKATEEVKNEEFDAGKIMLDYDYFEKRAKARRNSHVGSRSEQACGLYSGGVLC